MGFLDDVFHEATKPASDAWTGFTNWLSGKSSQTPINTPPPAPDPQAPVLKASAQALSLEQAQSSTWNILTGGSGPAQNSSMVAQGIQSSPTWALFSGTPQSSLSSGKGANPSLLGI